MAFYSKWITTRDFEHLKPINVFHKEKDKGESEESLIKNYHVHFRKKFVLDDTSSVIINITADDYYKLYVNGDFIGQGPAPSYPECYNYNQYDISSYLNSGENVIAVHTYYQGLNNRVWVSGDNRQGLIADVFQNNKFILGTDESWLYSIAKEFSGETIGYETAFLENIDFNLEEKGWTEIDFDDSNYTNAIIDKDADYNFAEFSSESLMVYKKTPKSIIKFDKGKYFIDFGEEITGQFYMSAKGIKGQKVTILCGEELEENSSLTVRYDMRCNCKYEEICTLSGKRDDFNFFDYKAFRYVNVFTETDNLDESSFCAVVRHHKFDEKFTLETDIKHLKDIWKICINSLKYGAQESLLDCPTREKGTYLGDFTVSGLAHMYITNDTEFYKKTLFDFAATSKVCKGLMGIANCSMMQEIADFSLQYPMQLLNYYKFTGDLSTVKKLYPVASGVLEYFEQFKRNDGLLENVNDKWNLVDWPQNLRDNYEAYIDKNKDGIDCHNVLNAFYIASAMAVNELAKILGLKIIYDIESLKEAFINAFYNHKTNLFCDTEKLSHSSLHSNALPLCFGIATEQMYGYIKDFIVSKGLCCGVQFSYFVLKALGEIGAYEEQLELLVNESEHSWVNMIREGATTCFEAWGKAQKWNTSLCHPWACAPIIILFEDLNNRFGIRIRRNERG